jgi:hypothetical protein
MANMSQNAPADGSGLGDRHPTNTDESSGCACKKHQRISSSKGIDGGTSAQYDPALAHASQTEGMSRMDCAHCGPLLEAAGRDLIATGGTALKYDSS